MTTYTLIHVVISLIAIAAGFVVLAGLLKSRRLDTWTALFLVTTTATSLTGFGFPFVRLLPSHIVGAISLVVLAVAVLARYSYHMAGGWRAAYVVTAVSALYFNVFVLIVQTFQKVPALAALAPTQSEPPFAITQLIVLLAFLALGYLAVVRFREKTGAVAQQFL
ncbi:MAG TPA: hypothetical protein VFB92_26260 [Vicinamibacterales bacterium]|jgi:hypothetical protein|nr:hypothetical protein [Vicinamibacterales bacterium]